MSNCTYKFRDVTGKQITIEGKEAFKAYLVDGGLDHLLDGFSPIKFSPVRAWHGSPHDHNKFDSSKIGTGEGAQAYGYGHYFASSREIAEWYKSKLSGVAEGFKPRGYDTTAWWDQAKELYPNSVAKQEAWHVLAQKENWSDPKEVAKWGKEMAYSEASRKVVDDVVADIYNPGKLYQVTLPEESTFLLWDKPLSEQTDDVKAAIRQMVSDGEFGKTGFRFEEQTGREAYVSLANMQQKYAKKGSNLEQLASLLLKDNGINGIKYLDGQSRNAGEGNFNYVVFDDNDIQIDAKFSKARINVDGVDRPTTNSNGKPIYPTEEGIRNFWRWFGDSKVVDEQGRPLVVYHGGDSDFDSFNYPTDALGIFTTDNRGVADVYGEMRKGKTKELYVKLQNPAFIDNDNRRSFELDADTFGGLEKLKSQYEENGFDGFVVMPDDGAENYGSGLEEEVATSYVAFKPTQIKSATGNNGDFSADNADIRYSTRRIVGDSGRQYTPEQRQSYLNLGRDVEDKNLFEKTRDYLKNDFFKKLAIGMVDQFRGLRDLNDGGQSYLLARLSKGTAGAVDALLHHGKLSIRDGVYDADQSGGFIDRLGVPLQGEIDDFLWWVAANRAEKLKRQGKENLFSDQDIANMKTLADGQTDFDYTIQTGAHAGQVTRDRTRIYADANRVFQEFQKNALDMAEQSGLIDGNARQYWESEFYVPFYRVSDEDGEFIGSKIGNQLVRQKAFHKLKGGTDKLHSDLLSNTLLNFSHLIDAAAKNRAAKSALQAAERVGVAHLATPGEKGTVWYADNGQKVEYKVDDPYVMTAITSLEYAGMNNGIMNGLSKFKHWLTIGVTASPMFKIRNLIRDSIQAIGTSDLGYNPITNIVSGFQQTNRDRQEYVSALASGALIRFGTMLEGNESARTRQLIKQGVKDFTVLNSDNKVKAFYDKFLEPAISAYNEIGNRSEEINRAALYNQLIAKGVGHAEAALMARDLMDFSMQGSWNSIRFLTQIVPFMNARLQGMYKLGRAAKEDPAKMAIVTGAVALASIALMLAYGDDDDWKRREDWDRDNYWWFKIGGVEWRIPKPFEIGAVATLAERSLEYMINPEMTGDRYLKANFALAMNNLSMNPVPQMVKPIVDLYANKDSFTGRPIETLSMQRLDPTMRYSSSTSMLARGASVATGGALSPVQVDHLIRGYFSWLGGFVVGGADMAIRSVSNEPTKPTRDYFNFFSQGMLKEEGAGSSRYISHVYDQAKELEQAHASYRQLLKEGKAAEAKEYFEDHRDELSRYRMVEKVKQVESKFSEQIRMIERSAMSPDEKKERIDKINKLKEIAAKRIAPGLTSQPQA